MLTNEDKAKIYDELIRESDRLQRINSKLKSEHVFNVPPQVQSQIDENERKIRELVIKLENLFR